MKRLFTLTALISGIAYTTYQAQSGSRNTATDLHETTDAKFIEVNGTRCPYWKFSNEGGEELRAKSDSMSPDEQKLFFFYKLTSTGSAPGIHLAW